MPNHGPQTGWLAGISPVVHLHELVFRHVQAIPQLASGLEGLLEIVDQLAGGAAGRRLLLLVILVLHSRIMHASSIMHNPPTVQERGEQHSKEVMYQPKSKPRETVVSKRQLYGTRSGRRIQYLGQVPVVSFQQHRQVA